MQKVLQEKYNDETKFSIFFNYVLYCFLYRSFFWGELCSVSLFVELLS